MFVNGRIYAVSPLPLTIFRFIVTLHENRKIMRRSVYALWLVSMVLMSVNLISCGKDEDSVPAGVSYQGDFVNAAHSTSGVASIDSTGTTLTLTNFKTDSGPDLNIYLASSLSTITSDFIDLGDMKGRNGTYDYEVPSSTDFDTYKYVVVWCVDFDVNFGYAELEKK